MESILEILSLEQGPMRGFIFGFVHVGILIVGYYSGWSLSRLLKKTSNGRIAGILGAVIAHILADLIASILDPTMRTAAFGILLGGLTPLLMIPIFEKYISHSSLKNTHVIPKDSETDFKT
tara:strand:+ start:654 stop:1016 length:363 start_codon:yes stop_codon:yes gene_type:complete